MWDSSPQFKVCLRSDKIMGWILWFCWVSFCFRKTFGNFSSFLQAPQLLPSAPEGCPIPRSWLGWRGIWVAARRGEKKINLLPRHRKQKIQPYSNKNTLHICRELECGDIVGNHDLLLHLLKLILPDSRYPLLFEHRRQNRCGRLHRISRTSTAPCTATFQFTNFNSSFL